MISCCSPLAAVAQNVIGVAVATLLGQHPLMGVLAGSVTLTGGPATGLAFAPLFESAGVPAAATLAVASAMVGIVAGGIIGGPIGTWLIARYRIRTPRGAAHRVPPRPRRNIVEDQMIEPPAQAPAGEDRESYVLLKTLVVMLVVMWIGGIVSAWLNGGWRGQHGAAGVHRCDARCGSVPQRRRDAEDRALAAARRRLGQRRPLPIPGPRTDDTELWEIVHIAVPLASSSC